MTAELVLASCRLHRSRTQQRSQARALQSYNSIQCRNTELMKHVHRDPTAARRARRPLHRYPRRPGRAGRPAAARLAGRPGRRRRGWCPINPIPPASCAVRSSIKYLRTVATQLCYWPSAAPGAAARRRRPRVLGVVLLVPARAAAGGADREAAGQAGRDELPERSGARSSAAVGHRARDAALGRAECRAVALSPGCVRRARHRLRSHPEHRRRRSLPVPAARRRSARTILSTRNFEELYNVACTLRAFRLVQDRYPEATLTLVGAGSEDAAAACARAASCGSRTSASPGASRPTTSGATTRDADIYLQTPDIDNMPSSVLEAFASGCAVVSTNAGGVPAILTDDVHGLLVECGDHAAAAERMLRLLDDPALVERLTAAAPRELRTSTSGTSVRSRWLALYESMVDHRRGRCRQPTRQRRMTQRVLQPADCDAAGRAPVPASCAKLRKLRGPRALGGGQAGLAPRRSALRAERSRRRRRRTGRDPRRCSARGRFRRGAPRARPALRHAPVGLSAERTRPPGGVRGDPARLPRRRAKPRPRPSRCSDGALRPARLSRPAPRRRRRTGMPMSSTAARSPTCLLGGRAVSSIPPPATTRSSGS